MSFGIIIHTRHVVVVETGSGGQKKEGDGRIKGSGGDTTRGDGGTQSAVVKVTGRGRKGRWWRKRVVEVVKRVVLMKIQVQTTFKRNLG